MSKATATRHLQDLVKLGIISNQGKGAGAIYGLVNKIQDPEAGNDFAVKELVLLAYQAVKLAHYF